MKWNESGFRPPLCTYRLNWARRTSWGWWDDWDDTVLQTQDSKFEPWRSEAEHATSRSRRLPTILTFTRGWGRNIFCFFETAGTGNRTFKLELGTPFSTLLLTRLIWLVPLGGTTNTYKKLNKPVWEVKTYHPRRILASHGKFWIMLIKLKWYK